MNPKTNITTIAHIFDSGVAMAGVLVWLTPRNAGLTDAGSAGLADAGSDGLIDAGSDGLTDAGSAALTDAGSAGLTDAGSDGLTDAARLSPCPISWRVGKLVLQLRAAGLLPVRRSSTGADRGPPDYRPRRYKAG